MNIQRIKALTAEIGEVIARHRSDGAMGHEILMATAAVSAAAAQTFGRLMTKSQRRSYNKTVEQSKLEIKHP